MRTNPVLEVFGVERVALAQVAGLVTALEPAHALRRRTVREGIRHDVTLRLLLDAIVADGACRVERALDVARLEDVLGFLRLVGPDAGEAVGLQFDADLNGVSLPLAHPLPHRVDLIHDAE